MATFRFKRQQLEDLFKEDYDGLRNFELMIQELQDLSDLGLDAPSVGLDTTNFNNIFDSSTTTLQRMADTVDDLSTADIRETGNLYYTNERVDDRVSNLIVDGVGLTWGYNDELGTLTGDVRISVFTTDDLDEGINNLYYTDARVGSYIQDNILTYGFESVTSSTTVTKTTTVFTGSTTGQTITLPTTGTAGRKVVVINNGGVNITISGSSVLTYLASGEDWEFTDTGTDWI